MELNNLNNSENIQLLNVVILPKSIRSIIIHQVAWWYNGKGLFVFPFCLQTSIVFNEAKYDDIHDIL